MKKNKYIILTLMMFGLQTQHISAACTQEELNEFKKNEDTYIMKYEYDKSTEKYNIYIEGKNNQLYNYIIYTDNAFECEETQDNRIKCHSFEPGNYKIEILGQTATCDSVLKRKTLKIPKYNKYSEDPLCEGIEEFVLCNPAYSKDLEYETFVSRVETYKKNHASTKPTEEQKKPTGLTKVEDFIDKIIDYVKENWIEITIVVVFIILVLITAIAKIKSIRKSRYLE